MRVMLLVLLGGCAAAPGPAFPDAFAAARAAGFSACMEEAGSAAPGALSFGEPDADCEILEDARGVEGACTVRCSR